MKMEKLVGLGFVASCALLGACGGDDNKTTDTSTTTGTKTGATCTTLPKMTQKAAYRVAFVQLYEASGLWRTANTNSIVGEAQKRGWEMLYNPGTTDAAEEQVARMQEAIDAKPDAIIIAPHDKATLSPMVVKARKACIPVFIEDRSLDDQVAIPGVDYVTYVGSDFQKEGTLIAQWLAKKTGGTASIVEYEGTIGSSAAVDRKTGFDTEVAKYPGMKILASESADFSVQTGYEKSKTLLPKWPQADWIFVHNDGMGFGVVKYLEEVGKVPGKDIKIVSIDGTKQGAEYIRDGKFEAITECNPKFGPLLFDTIEKYGKGEAIPLSLKNEDRTFDITNVAAYLPEAF